MQRRFGKEIREDPGARKEPPPGARGPAKYCKNHSHTVKQYENKLRGPEGPENTAKTIATQQNNKKPAPGARGPRAMGLRAPFHISLTNPFAQKK